MVKKLKLSKRIYSLMLSGCLLFSAFYITSCGDDDNVEVSRIPVILSVSPSSGEPGDQVTITGTDLENAESVEFGQSTASVTSNTATEIVATVPEDAVTGKISVTTAGGTAVSETDFEVIRVGAPSVTGVSAISAEPGENIVISGTEMETVSNVQIGGVDATVVNTSESSVEVTVGDSPLGLNTIAITNEGGTTTTSTDAVEFYVIDVLDEFNDTFDRESDTFSSGGDAEITAWGNSSTITGAERLPNGVNGNFYHIEGVSDLDDSGTYTGQIGHSQQDAGSMAGFFAPGSDPAEYYFNIQLHWSGPEGYDDILGGLRLRFDEGYDADEDGSTSDEYIAYQPTPSMLAEAGFTPDENGWYTLSVPLDQFTASGPRDGAGSWAVYDIDQMTRFAVASRRNHTGEYSLSIDNIFISRGGPYSFSNPQ